MRNFTKRSLAMLLFLLMVFGCMQGVVMPTFADESGSIGSGTGSAGGTSVGGSSNYAGGLLSEAFAGVSLQVVYYHYSDVYNAEKMYTQVINSVRYYGTANDKSLKADGSKMDLTVFAPYYLTDDCYIYNSYKSSPSKGNVYKLDVFPSGFPNTRRYNYTRRLGDTNCLFTKDQYRVSDTAVSNFLKRIILGNSYGAWNKEDVYDSSASTSYANDTSTYAKVLRELGVSNTHIDNYLRAYNGKIGLVTDADKNTLIPVIIWKFISYQTNRKNPNNNAGEDASYIYVPMDMAVAFKASKYGNGEDNHATRWWVTPYPWDYSTTNTTFEGSTVKKYTSSVYTNLCNRFETGGKCGWNPDCSYFCKILFGTGHAAANCNHGNSNYRWYESVSDPCIIGSGFVNAIGSDGYDRQSYKDNAYHFRGYWAPFGVGTGGISITKVNQANPNQTLAGATFELYKSYSNGTFSSPVTASDYTVAPSASNNTGYVNAYTRKTNSSGIATYKNLRSGLYWLKESIAPSGYQRVSEPRMVAVVNGVDKPVIFENPPAGSVVTIQKASSASTAVMTQLSGNSLYSLAGAQYKVSATGKADETITLNASGRATTTTRYGVGTVITVVETKAPPGYKLNSTPYTFTVTASGGAFTVKDEPVFDPGTIQFQKTSATTGSSPMGNASFEGAIFKWEYFAKLKSDGTPDTSGTPTRTWYFKTDSDGFYDYSSTSLVDNAVYNSDSLYTTVNNRQGIPLGSIKVTEVVAPAGYDAMPVLYATVTQPTSGGRAVFDWTDASWNNIIEEGGVYNGIEPEEDPSGTLSLKKLDANGGSEPQGDVVSLKARFQVINRSAGSVKVGSHPVAAPGRVCYIFDTDDRGVYNSGEIFPIGSYEVREIDPPQGMTLNSTWVGRFSITEDERSASLVTPVDACVNEPIRGGFTLSKVDADRRDTNIGAYGYPQGGATFEGTTFNVYNKSTNPVYVNGTKYAKNAVCFTFTLDASGTYSSATDLLPYGRYEIKEVSAGTGYKVNSSWVGGLVIGEDDNGNRVEVNSYTVNPLKEPIIRCGIKVEKIDRLTNKAEPQGDASLAGTVLNVVNSNPYAVYTDRDGNGAYAWYISGQVCLKLTTNASGIAQSANNALPYGKYTIKEASAPTGYKLNSSWSVEVNAHADGTIVSASSKLVEDHISGGVRVVKQDAILGDETDGTAALEGITFSVYNKSAKSVRVNDRDYAPNAVVATMTLQWDEANSEWAAQLGNTVLPYGTYLVKENPKTQGSGYANDYYALSNEGFTFKIRTDGQIVNVNTSNEEIVFHNFPLGKIELTKVNARNDVLAGVKFSLEWSEDGNTWEPVRTVANGTYVKGGSTSAGIVDGCLLTNDAGYLVYDGLDSTLQYRLTEVETLDGYQLLSEPVYTGVLSRNEDNKVSVECRVVNAEAFTIPESGSRNMLIIPMITAICVAVFTVALVYSKKKKDELTP